MSTTPRLFLVLASLSLVLAGCSGGGSGAVLAPPTEQSTEQRVTAVMQEVVLPTLEQLGVDADTASAENRKSAPAKAAAGISCTDPINCTPSGSFQICSGAPDGALEWVYSSCDRPNGVVDGTWSILFQNPWVVQYGLTVDELDLDGSVSFELVGLCWTHTLDSLSAVGTKVTTTLDGAVEYCFDEPAIGTLELLVVDEDSSFQMTLDMTEDGASVRVVFEGSETNCTVDTQSGDAECNSVG